ncbi:hypothetical protein [Nostoc favosum]|uniref:Uncharacterized protein n=1 Tax=Nostoc favosum CHAB5714 TaxID=2780399 RepID=A0ABS8I6U0_9NOSO|nr:hypothetical protein [Nostoc favosum]MCC5599861.1 hypothetical protein [Nostoc favosum CHAB5714]
MSKQPNLETQSIFCGQKMYPEDDSIRSARGFWIQAGLHPPNEDPRAK